MPPPPWDGAGGVQEAHNQDDSDEEQEQEQDEDLELMEVPGAEAPFPSDEYLALADSLTQLHVANFAPGRLAEAVAAAETFFRGRKSRLRQGDLEAVRKLLRDGIAYGFDKTLRDHHLYTTNTSADEEELFHALHSLVQLAALLLELRAFPSAPRHAAAAGAPPPPSPAAAQMVELDGELQQLVGLVTALFNSEVPLHAYHQGSEVPQHIIDAPQRQRWACPLQRTDWDSAEGDEDEDELLEDVQQQHEWLVALINTFGDSKGFHAIFQLLSHFQSASLGVQMVAQLATLLGKAAPYMPSETLTPFQSLIKGMLEQLVPLAQSDDDFLSDQGQDRTYTTLRHLLTAAGNVLGAHVGGVTLEIDAALGPVQQAFVLRMMESTNFVKQLSGVRELHIALHRTTKLPMTDRPRRLKEFVGWMEEHRLVERMLRNNLHQRQYMQQVNSILQLLAEYGQLTNAHLDQLWSVTEQEGTYEGVKAHVYEGLADLVCDFKPDQVDFLFTKMAARRERSALDTTKLLELLLRLAKSDTECALPERITNLMWDIVTEPGCPRAIVESGAKQLADVAQEYSHTGGKQSVLLSLVQRARAELAARRNHVVALKVLVQGMDAWQATSPRNVNVIERYNTQHGLFKLLVTNAAALARDARAFVSQHAAAAAAGTVASAGGGPAAAPPAHAAPPPPGEGAWSHSDLLLSYLYALQRLYDNSTSYMDRELADLLWAELVQGAVSKADMNRAVAYFKSAIFASEPWLEPPVVAALLRRVPELPPQFVTKDVYTLTWQMFAMVNKEHLVGDPPGGGGRKILHAKTLSIQDLDHLWTLFESCTITNVANMFQERLLELYHCVDYETTDDAAEFRTAFVREFAQRLEAAVAELDRHHHHQQQQQQQHQQQQQQPATVVTRRIFRLMDAMKSSFCNCMEPTMPPVPSHQLSWQGSPVMVDVHGQQQPRMRVSSHTNEYVGALRAKVARLLGGASPKRVRLFHAGQEFTDDADTVGQLEIRGGRQVVNVQLSPVDNHNTQLPDEYREHYEAFSLVWLLSRQPRIFGLLFHVIDGPYAAQLAQPALGLLQQMPTSPVLAAEVGAGLEQQQQQAAGEQQGPSGPLAKVLLGQLSSSNGGGSGGGSTGEGGAAVPRPYQLLYRMQALAALLFPSVQDAPREAPPAESEGAGEHASAASPPHAPTHAAPAAEAPTRRALQERFLASGGLRVVCALVDRLVAARAGDAPLLRELGQLVVVLIHNLMDAATPRAAGPLARAATPEAPSASVSAPAAHGEGHGAAAEAEVGDSAMEDVEEGAAGREGGGAGNGCAPGGGGHSSSTATPVRGAEPGALADVDRGSRPGSVDAEGAEARPVPQAGGGDMDEGQAGAEQRQAQQQHLPPRPRAASLPPPQPPRAAGAAPLCLDGPALRLMSGTLLQLAVQAARQWGAAPGVVRRNEDEAGSDVALVREALGLLQRVLDLRPELLAPLLVPGGAGGAIVADLLLSPFYSAVRAVAEDCLGRLCCSAPGPLAWLLAELCDARPLAAARPGASGDFYKLFARAVRALQAVEGVLKGTYVRAEALLADEVAALQALGPAGGDDANVALEGRLHLLLALVTTLDRRCVGAGREAGLIQLLLSEYLFPQARLAQDERAGRLALAECEARLRPRCASAGARRAALDLVAELMREGLGPLEEGVRCLEALLDAAAPPSWPVTPLKAVRRPGDYCGLRNAGATCYMNAVFQQLYMQPRIRALILGAPEVPEADRGDSVFAQLQAVFAAMALGLTSFHTPEGFWRAFKDYDGQPIDTREHQDAYEFFTRLQDCVDSHLQSVRCTPALQSVMGGRFAQQVICRGLPYRSEREEEFLQISVDVRGMGTLEKSLENYVQGELMEGDNAYLCEELGRRVPAVKRACIKALPHTLVIHLKRFEFDYHSQTRFKVRDRFEFGEELDLFPYTADGLAAAEAEAAASAAAGGAGEQAAPGGGLARQSSAGDGGGAAAAGAAGGGGSGGGSGAHPGYVYDLAGVVVHSGSAFTGHYYSYAREREALAAAAGVPGAGAAAARAAARGGGWFCFDDKSVKPWDAGNLEADCFGGRASQDYASRMYRAPRNEVDRPHSAYMLFYERRCEARLNLDALQGRGRSAQRPAAEAPPAPPGGEGAAAEQQPSGGGQPGATQAPQQEQAQAPEPGEPPAAAASAAAAAGPVPSPAPGGFVAPWGMPLSLYRQVQVSNITIMMAVHTLDREFFKFVRMLVENRGEVGGQLSQRKARRRELPPLAPAPASVPPPIVSPGGGGGGAAAAGSGGSCSAMSCDPAASAPADVGGAAAGGGGGGGGYEQLPSPGPSSRRGEEAEQVATTLTRLALRFQLQLYQRAAAALRADSPVWAEALKSLLNAGPSAAACQLAALRLLEAQHGWLREMLVMSPDPASREFVADVIAFLMVHAAQRSNMHHALLLVAAAQAAGDSVHGAVAAGAAALPLAAALVALVDRLVTLLGQAAACAAAPDGDDTYGAAAAAAVLRDYVVGAPPAHAALLLALRPDLAGTLVEHLVALAAAGEDELREDGPAVVSLLYALVSRAGNLERLTGELLAAASEGAQGPPGPLLGGALNPFASPARSAAAGAGGAGAGAAGGVEGQLAPRALKRLHSHDVLDVLTDASLLQARDTVSLLQLLCWEHGVTSVRVVSRSLLAAAAAHWPAAAQLLLALVSAARELAGVQDSLVMYRLWAALTPNDEVGYPGLASLLLDSPSQGWCAVRKMLLVSAVEPALRLHGLPAATALVAALFGQSVRGGPLAIAQELGFIERELSQQDQHDAQALTSLIRSYGGGVALLKTVAYAAAQQLQAAPQQRQQQRQPAGAAGEGMLEDDEGAEQGGAAGELQGPQQQEGPVEGSSSDGGRSDGGGAGSGAKAAVGMGATGEVPPPKRAWG